MKQHHVGRLLSLVIAALAIAIVGCSSVPTPIQEALASPTPLPTSEPTATLAAPPTPQATEPLVQSQPQQRNLLAVLNKLGLEAGVVQAVNESALTLRTGRNPTQIKLAPTTVILVPGVNKARATDIQAGDRVVVNVPEDGGDSPAQFVLGFPKGYTAENVAAGLVQSNSKGTLVLKTRGGSQEVSAAKSAVVVNVQEEVSIGSLADLRRGAAALVIGQKEQETMQGQVILILDRNALALR